MFDNFINSIPTEKLIMYQRLLLSILITFLMIFSFIMGNIKGQIDEVNYISSLMNKSSNNINNNIIFFDCKDVNTFSDNCVKGIYHIEKYIRIGE